MQIPHSQPWITDKELSAVKKVLISNMVAIGDIATELEKFISEMLGKQSTFLTGSGTSALLLILQTLGIGKGDQVILPTYVCDKILDAVKFVGATPVICDVGKNWVMEVEQVTPLINKNTKAIILVHIFGINANAEIFNELNVPIIEDICQSLGGWTSKNFSGKATSFAFGSFQATKCVTAGEGGFASFSNFDAIDKAKKIKNKNPFFHGFNDIQASLVLSQLRRYQEFIQNRKKISEIYLARLPSSVVDRTFSIAPKSMFFRFPILVYRDWKELSVEFEENGIVVRKGVDSLIHLKLGLPNSNFQNSIELYNHTLSLPILPQLSSKQISHIIKVSHEIL